METTLTRAWPGSRVLHGSCRKRTSARLPGASGSGASAGGRERDTASWLAASRAQTVACTIGADGAGSGDSGCDGRRATSGGDAGVADGRSGASLRATHFAARRAMIRRSSAMARGNRRKRTRKGMILGEVDMANQRLPGGRCPVCNPHALRESARAALSPGPMDRASSRGWASPTVRPAPLGQAHPGVARAADEARMSCRSRLVWRAGAARRGVRALAASPRPASPRLLAHQLGQSARCE